METWHIRIGFRANRPFSETLAFEMSEHLEDFAAVMSTAGDMNSGSVALTIDASEWSAALEVAHTAVLEALESEDVEAIVTSVGVQSQEEFQAELNEPVYPPVVGFAEIARMVGVSRQRARQLAGSIFGLSSVRLVQRGKNRRSPSPSEPQSCTAGDYVAIEVICHRHFGLQRLILNPPTF